MTNRFDRVANRYLTETLAGAALFVLASYIAHEIGRDVSDPLQKIGLAVAAMFPMALVLWAHVRYYKKVDERERQIVAVGGALTLLLAVFTALLFAKLEPFWKVNMNDFGAFLMVSWALTTTVVRRIS